MERHAPFPHGEGLQRMMQVKGEIIEGTVSQSCTHDYTGNTVSQEITYVLLRQVMAFTLRGLKEYKIG